MAFNPILSSPASEFNSVVAEFGSFAGHIDDGQISPLPGKQGDRSRHEQNSGDDTGDDDDDNAGPGRNLRQGVFRRTLLQLAGSETNRCVFPDQRR